MVKIKVRPNNIRAIFLFVRLIYLEIHSWNGRTRSDLRVNPINDGGAILFQLVLEIASGNHREPAGLNFQWRPKKSCQVCGGLPGAAVEAASEPAVGRYAFLPGTGG